MGKNKTQIKSRSSFIAWLLLYPLVDAACGAINWQFCERREYTDGVIGLAAFFTLFFYLFIANLLWKDGNDKE